MDTQCTFLQYYKCHKMSLNNYNVLLLLIFSAIKKNLNGGGMSQLLHCPIPANGVT